MAKFLISYDYHKIKNYAPLYEKLEKWKAAQLLESLWLANLNGDAGQVVDALTKVADADDSFAVIELKSDSGWATTKGVFVPGVEWLERNL